MVTLVDSSLIAGYLVVVLVIGYVSGRKQTSGDFMIAERKLGLFAFVSTVVASSIGGTILVVYSAYIYEFGVSALAGFAGFGAGMVAFMITAKELRKKAHEMNFHTMADFFIHKIGRGAGLLVGAVISVMIISAILKQFIAGTVILSAVSGWGYELSLLISAAVVLVYLVLGGFASVVKTDIFQYLILILFMAVIATGAVTESHLSFADITAAEGSPTLALSFFVYGFLSIWFLNEIWQRMYAAASDAVVRRGLLISGAFMLAIGVGITLIALSVRATTPGLDPSQTIVYGMTSLVPPQLLAFGIVLLFAAIMSTMDTFIFMLATNIVKDGAVNLRGKRLSERDLVRWTRASIIIIIFAATGLAYVFRDIIDVALITVGLGMSVVPSIAASLRAKPAQASVVASIAAGLAATAGFVLAGVVTPESMVAVVLVSAAALGATELWVRQKVVT
ncbi:MAG: sodium:solute symporter family protein [Parcubacteria group bacterium]|nr:sodium:solute symporter family protein [Parcubacteria group bacterium]